jgi:hypothetical protein
MSEIAAGKCGFAILVQSWVASGDPSLGGATERSKLLELLENPPLHLIGTPSGRIKLLRSHVLCNAEASRLAEDLGLSTARGG